MKKTIFTVIQPSVNLFDLKLVGKLNLYILKVMLYTQTHLRLCDFHKSNHNNNN